MAVAIPCRTDLADYRLTCMLDGVRYELQFNWSEREDSWFVSLRTEDGTSIAEHVRVVVGFPLMQRTTSPVRPPGCFFAHDTSGLGLEAGYGDLGGRVQFCYFAAADLPITYSEIHEYAPVSAIQVVGGG